MVVNFGLSKTKEQNLVYEFLIEEQGQELPALNSKNFSPLRGDYSNIPANIRTNAANIPGRLTITRRSNTRINKHPARLAKSLFVIVEDKYG